MPAIPMAGNKLSPFNSQNTFISGKWLKDYFLFPHVGRMDDIWAAYYVEALGAQVVYNKATVYQQRNIHDLVVDMKKEYCGYENNLQIVNELPGHPEAMLKYLPAQSAEACGRKWRSCGASKQTKIREANGIFKTSHDSDSEAYILERGSLRCTVKQHSRL